MCWDSLLPEIETSCNPIGQPRAGNRECEMPESMSIFWPAVQPQKCVRFAEVERQVCTCDFLELAHRAQTAVNSGETVRDASTIRRFGGAASIKLLHELRTTDRR